MTSIFFSFIERNQMLHLDFYYYLWQLYYVNDKLNGKHFSFDIFDRYVYTKGVCKRACYYQTKKQTNENRFIYHLLNECDLIDNYDFFFNKM